MTNTRTTWQQLADRAPSMNPDAFMVRDLIAKSKAVVIEVSDTNGQARIVASLAAATANCDSPVDGEPDGSCSGCADAFSDGGLAVVWVPDETMTAAGVRRLRKNLTAESFVQWQIVAIRLPGRGLGKATRVELEKFLKRPPSRTTILLMER